MQATGLISSRHNYATKSPLHGNTYNGMPHIYPQTTFPFDDHTHLIHPSLDRPRLPHQTASRFNQPFCHSTLSGQTNRQTDRQTDQQIYRREKIAGLIIEEASLTQWGLFYYKPNFTGPPIKNSGYANAGIQFWATADGEWELPVVLVGFWCGLELNYSLAYIIRSHPEMVGDMSRLACDLELWTIKITFVHF